VDPNVALVSSRLLTEVGLQYVRGNISEDQLVVKPYESPFQQGVAGGIKTGRSLLSLARRV
jgi:hypothetical protein